MVEYKKACSFALFLYKMKRKALISDDKLFEEKRKAIEEQIRKEVMLLKEFDPDEELKKEFEYASLVDLQKYLDD